MKDESTCNCVSHSCVSTLILHRNIHTHLSGGLVTQMCLISFPHFSCCHHVCVTSLSPLRYADLLTPYMNSVPAVIAKASAIHNPIIYAITHPKYR